MRQAPAACDERIRGVGWWLEFGSGFTSKNSERDKRCQWVTHIIVIATLTVTNSTVNSMKKSPAYFSFKLKASD